MYFASKLLYILELCIDVVPLTYTVIENTVVSGFNVKQPITSQDMDQPDSQFHGCHIFRKLSIVYKNSLFLKAQL